MLDWVAKVFRTWMEIILWLVLIGLTIVGAVVGAAVNGGAGAFLGLIVGFIVGLISDIIGGGFIANFLSMVDNIERLTNNANINSFYAKHKNQDEIKKCPFCAEEIKKEAIICHSCGRNIQEYENEKKLKEQEERKQKEQELKEKFKNVEDLFNDKNIMEEAKKLRRLYGKGMYISYLKDKAKELGLGDITLTEDDIE